MMVVVGSGVVRARDVIRPGEAVGPVRIGMTGEELARAVGPGQALAWERSPMPSPGVDVRHYASRGFDVVLATTGREPAVRCVLGGGMEAMANRFRYRSAEGIGMGSTLDEIVAAWGEPERLREFAAAEAPVIEAAYPSRGITLMLDAGRVNWLAVRAAEAAG